MASVCEKLGCRKCKDRKRCHCQKSCKCKELLKTQKVQNLAVFAVLPSTEGLYVLQYKNGIYSYVPY